MLSRDSSVWYCVSSESINGNMLLTIEYSHLHLIDIVIDVVK